MQEQEVPTRDENLVGKNVAIISYITLIGWILALLMNSNEKSKLGSFHLRQSLGIMVLALATYVINIPFSHIPYLGWITGLILNIGLVVMWIIGLISAIKAEQKPLPLIGESIQKWFGQLN